MLFACVGKFDNGSVPLTSAERLTDPNVGAPAALPCKTVIVVPSEPKAEGAVPEPPPKRRRFAVKAGVDAIVVEEEKYGIPPETAEER